MDISVGAEYVVANALIVLCRHQIYPISCRDLRSIGWKIQQLCNENGIDATILTSGNSIKEAIYDFSDYFEYIDDGEPMIRMKKDVPIENLEDRFVYCRPDDVAELMEAQMPILLQV